MMNENGNNPNHIPLDELLQYIDDLVAAFQEHPDAETRETVNELMRANDTLHWQAFQRFKDFLAARQAEHLLAEAAEADRLIYTLLSLYDVLPDTVVIEQVDAALDSIRPYIESHGGHIKVRSVDGGTVHLEMGGACQGCPGAKVTLERGVQKALANGFPSFEEMVVHEPEVGATGQQGLISLDQIYTPPSFMQAPVFQTVLTLEELAANAMKQVTLEGTQLLIAQIEGEVYAVADLCPGSALPLSSGELKGTSVVCPWHGDLYDIRTGECLDRAGRRETASLAIYPVAVEEGQVQVAINVPTRPLLAKIANG
jgi:nitrite reductase/ring-hydroxylating ferredoxin subunit/Fe-S cluster biogenesis protein NfuA